MEYLNEIKSIFLILGVIVSVIITLFIHLKFAPVIKISVDSKRISDEISLVNIQIENISKVRVKIKKEKDVKSEANILLQYFEHDSQNIEQLTEFIPFTKEWFDKKNYPSTWKEARIIFETTEWIYPNETISIERPIVHNKDKILHMGIQVHAKFGVLELASLRHLSQRWTLVKFII